jgi:hypothetical protein
MKLSEWDLGNLLPDLRNGKSVVMFIHNEDNETKQDDVQLTISPYGEMKKTSNENEDTLLNSIYLSEQLFELIETENNEKFIYSNGKRFRYGFKVSDGAVMLKTSNSKLIIVNNDNSEDEIEV